MLADVELGRRGVERTTKHQSSRGAKILIKEAAANYQVEYRSWVLSGVGTVLAVPLPKQIVRGQIGKYTEVGVSLAKHLP